MLHQQAGCSGESCQEHESWARMNLLLYPDSIGLPHLTSQISVQIPDNTAEDPGPVPVNDYQIGPISSAFLVTSVIVYSILNTGTGTVQ
jgi:hypothetical protein